MIEDEEAWCEEVHGEDKHRFHINDEIKFATNTLQKVYTNFMIDLFDLLN